MFFKYLFEFFYRICLKNERERLIEMYERKEKRLIKCYEILRKNKRQKFENEVDSFEDEDQEKKLKEAQKEIELLISENSSLKQQIQKLVEEHNIIAVECSTLKFTISEKDRMLKEAKKAMEAKVAGGNALELELRRQLEEAQTKINVMLSFSFLKSLKFISHDFFFLILFLLNI